MLQSSWLGSLWESSTTQIPEEKMEEYRMLSGFKSKEIIRLHELFHKHTDGIDRMKRDVFLDLDGIVNNPLKERIAMCFGFDDEVQSLDFQAFLVGVALFNSPGRREQKMKTAFRLQDFDNDGSINKSDLIKYLELVSTGLDEKQISEIADQVLKESASDALQETITFSDFQRIVAPLDFQAKLLLPL